MNKKTKKTDSSSKKKSLRTTSSNQNQSIIICGKSFSINTSVVLWNQKGGLKCPNKRGRSSCTQHQTSLNEAPTQTEKNYKILNPEKALQELNKTVYQLILHYDECFSSHHCHQILKNSSFKGSHFYLDLDGTIYQTCDLYWKTNTAPADDGKGNERAIHVEIANLSWQALSKESDLHHLKKNAYIRTKLGWKLLLPDVWKKKLRTKNFQPFAARSHGSRGYFSRHINGKIVRMWDFTEEQYLALIQLAIGLNSALPKISIRVPFDKNKKRTPLDKIKNFSTFSGILGHAHVQSGTPQGIRRKYDPGSSFNWGRLRRAFKKYHSSNKFK